MSGVDIAFSTRLRRKLTQTSNQLTLRLLPKTPRAPGADWNGLERARRVLVVRLDQLGDLVLTGPMLHELRHSAPRARITLVVRPEMVDLAERCPYVDEIVPYDAHTNLTATIRLAHMRRFQRDTLGSRKFEMAVAPRWDTDEGDASFLTFLSGATVRIGYPEDANPTKQVMNQGYNRLFTHLAETSSRHEAQRSFDILAKAGAFSLGRAAGNLESWTAPEDRQFAGNELRRRGAARHDGPLIAFGIGAGSPRRIWPAERYAELGRRLIELTNARIVILGSEADRVAGEAIRADSPAERVMDMAGKCTLRQSAALLQRSDLFIGSDSGPMHLAAAAGIPVVEISCHPAEGDIDHENSPERFGPWRVPSTILQPAEPAEGCIDSCRSGAAHCILAISTDSVFDAAKTMLTDEESSEVEQDAASSESASSEGEEPAPEEAVQERETEATGAAEG